MWHTIGSLPESLLPDATLAIDRCGGVPPGARLRIAVVEGCVVFLAIGHDVIRVGPRGEAVWLDPTEIEPELAAQGLGAPPC